MAARIIRLRTKADRVRQADGARLRQMVLQFASDHQVPERAVGEIIAAIDRETAGVRGWRFVMVDPEINSSVVKWLIQHSSRPMVAVSLWAELFSHLPNDGCEIMRTRAELAASLGATVTPDHVSSVMGELASIGAISRKRTPDGGVRYFVNPLVGTHLTGAARGRLQALAKPLNFDPPNKAAKEQAKQAAKEQAKQAAKAKKAKAKAPHLSVVPAE